ncbi:phosphomethylpyrimidine synthase 2 [Moorella thermoacetica]|uniref:5-hydroxybenzimidazole synthase BzaB n=2 Tax=Neomoorella thermoacetica TaxID=1525 RepID=BZAB_MOOTA|nr:B12 lower ligand biosynthesis ThiC-like protein BzaB [Moorella thermoacetica]Q2RHR5.1 RecName: Full=5-hydroxybenzimidazole synthase BzaB; Short=5-OHBza synthase; Short=HBI synthase [Moorella thermoacetica ATCC 39073]AKV89417.1 BzaB [Moorella thermoacetica]AKX94524.1 phosphomethylpyrimidine synthase [Moorella thermoacetica]AKX97160.1 phosphomethylpyrimidine synthase [Moorella thermoacetica]AOQ24449.1 Phosphomethylpyrimidine synthase [Moorella thermoacetica]OIQ57421.1 phosphomethylpyrimidine
MSQVLDARAGKITPEMEKVAADEKVDVEFVRAGVAEGTIVIPRNTNRKVLKPCGIGRGLRIKVNALIGTSSDRDDRQMEMRKIAAAEAAGCDSFMDLSTGGDIDEMRRLTLAHARVPVGSVPIYQAAIEAIEKRGSIVAMTPDDMFAAVEKQARDGIDFMAIHSALNFEILERLQASGRVTDIVSRGGAFLTGWMLHNQKENPLYEQFDRLLEILLKYDVTLSLGDAIRPGSTADSLDGAQLQGMIVAGELVRRAREAGVQVMVEGPGHVPLNHVETTMKLQKSLCGGAPYFILGTLATDVAPGYDHITAAIGGALAGTVGADFICYVTPAEHLGLPTEQDVKEGVIAARIAAHAADLARGNRQAWERDLQMARARVALDVEKQISLAIDQEKARSLLDGTGEDGVCAACGTNCAALVAARYFGMN